MSAYVEMLPPDRPIFMLGQPIIKLVASGGPGGDLGDMGRRGRRRRRGRRWGPPFMPAPLPFPAAPPPVQILNVTPISSDDSAFDSAGSMPAAADVMGQYSAALQQELTAVAEGAAPDVSAEYFRPKDVPGLPSGYEGPHTGRQGVYPQKLRDMVVYDMSGNNVFVTPADLAGAGAMENFGGSLGCCGADDMSDFGMTYFATGMSDFGMTYFDTGMGQAADTAKLLKGRCEGLESKAREIVAAVVKANGDASITLEQRKAVARSARASLKALRGEWRACRARLKEIIRHFKKKGNLKELGLSGVADAIGSEEKLARCKAKVRAIREIACKKKQK